MGNNAVHVNPSNIPITINEKGSDWLWAVRALLPPRVIALILNLGLCCHARDRPWCPCLDVL